MKRINIKPSIYIAFSCLIIILYHLPYFIHGEDSNLIIHDNLDSNIAWAKVLIDNNSVFPKPLKSIPIMGEVPFASFYGVYDLNLAWLSIFGIYKGYVFAKLMQSFIALFGMILLLKTHFYHKNNIIITSGALLFSILPFWSYTLSVAALPILMYAFLNIRNNNNKIYNWLIIIVYPFVSSLFLTGLFFLITFSFLYLYDWIKSKKANPYSFLSILTLSTFYIISHFPLFFLFFLTPFKSNRVEKFISPNTFNSSYELTKDIFLNGQYHAHSLHLYLIPIIMLGLILKVKSKQNILLIFIVVTSFIYGFINWSYFISIIELITHYFPIQLQRFHFLHPPFWYISAIISAIIISNKMKLIGKVLIIFVFGYQLQFLWSKHETRDPNNKISFKEFYDTSLFQSISEYIPNKKDSYNVLCLGFEPSIAQFNNFNTLDSYSPNYSLKYKKEFRKIIEKELDKNISIKNYFDNWGGRCYAFSSELGIGIPNNSIDEISQLNYNFNQILKMGGKYILSLPKINTDNVSNLQLLKVFSTKESIWKIHLYKINNDKSFSTK